MAEAKHHPPPSVDHDRLKAFRERIRLDRPQRKTVRITPEDRERRLREVAFANETGISQDKFSLRHPAFNQPEGYHSLEELVSQEMALAAATILKARQEARETTLREEKRQQLINYFNALSEQEQDELLFSAKTKAERGSTFTAATAYHPPPLPPVGGDYKTLPSRVRMSHADVVAFAQEVWGPWLKSCHPTLPCDAMTRQDLEARDPRLYNRLTRDLPPSVFSNLMQTHSERVAAATPPVIASNDLETLAVVGSRVASQRSRAKRKAEMQHNTEQSPAPN